MLGVIVGYAVVADTRRRIRWLNRAPVGRSPADYIDTDLAHLVIDEQRPIVADAVARLSSGAPSLELEVQGAATGRWHSARLVRLAQREAIFVHAFDIDDSKRMQTELAIARAQLSMAMPENSVEPEQADRRRLQLMADALPMLISYVDRDQRYRYNNAAYERWYGISREDLRGRTLEEVLGARAYAGIRPYVDVALSGRMIKYETTLPLQGAGVRTFVARYVPDLTARGEIAGFYALIEDVSAQREAEATLRRREDQLWQLQKLDALGRFAGGIAHEFRNLLMTIITGCTAVAESLEPNTPQAKMVAQVERAAQRGTSLTRQLLSFSRGGDFQTGPVEFDAVIEDVVVLLGRLLDSRIQLEAELGADAWICADAGQIQQVLMNLAINARDAMPDGGRIRVVTTTSGAHVLLSVSDTGIGMDEATRARIFEPFFTTKPPGVGTGLGLPTVYGIVRQAGGHIEVDSAVGVGTVFRLYFPTCSPACE
jgi:PAS domain S-box-containing protein